MLKSPLDGSTTSLIPKPGKDKGTLSSHRPIFSTSCTSEVKSEWFCPEFNGGRTFSVRCGSHVGDRKDNRTGVPQGSVQSTLLFEFAMASLPHYLAAVPDVGFIIWEAAGDIRHQPLTLQSGLNTIDAHPIRMGLRASPENTSYGELTPK
ncbi:hypothetical protein IscW_ISCW010497 [Ixodes scapularis]|uniref:Uncharacterized protein n=1 Tax=Ixodes scapularis TaxID=6945 RepID=B7Q6S1_IXOSC|nr:hypothetical protein IscW_ISCW010497 [Ixodes scapularis]|eukprot:XP_002403287.1 hypothetical protein IscW_ISCW010497 [Ixodes scapularis]